MKHVQNFATAAIALFVVGCGGTGNNSNPGPGPNPVGPNSRLEAIVKILPTNLQHPGAWTLDQLNNPQSVASSSQNLIPAGTPLQQDTINPSIFGVQDPANFQVGEEYVFQVVNYTPDPAQPSGYDRNIVPGATFVSTDATGVYGTMAGNTGDYIAGSTTTSTPIVVGANVNGNSYSTAMSIKIRQVRLLGTVLAQGTNANQLAGTHVQFYNPSGALVDDVTVAYDGTFRASVPPNANVFTVFADSIPQTFWQSFMYSQTGLQYTAGAQSCAGLAPLPAGMVVGFLTLPGGIFVTPRNSSFPADPTSNGCTAVIVKGKQK